MESILFLLLGVVGLSALGKKGKNSSVKNKPAAPPLENDILQKENLEEKILSEATQKEINDFWLKYFREIIKKLYEYGLIDRNNYHYQIDKNAINFFSDGHIDFKNSFENSDFAKPALLDDARVESKGMINYWVNEWKKWGELYENYISENLDELEVKKEEFLNILKRKASLKDMSNEELADTLEDDSDYDTNFQKAEKPEETENVETYDRFYDYTGYEEQLLSGGSNGNVFKITRPDGIRMRIVPGKFLSIRNEDGGFIPGASYLPREGEYVKNMEDLYNKDDSCFMNINYNLASNFWGYSMAPATTFVDKKNSGGAFLAGTYQKQIDGRLLGFPKLPITLYKFRFELEMFNPFNEVLTIERVDLVNVSYYGRKLLPYSDLFWNFTLMLNDKIGSKRILKNVYLETDRDDANLSYRLDKYGFQSVIPFFESDYKLYKSYSNDKSFRPSKEAWSVSTSNDWIYWRQKMFRDSSGSNIYFSNQEFRDNNGKDKNFPEWIKYMTYPLINHFPELKGRRIEKGKNFFSVSLGQKFINNETDCGNIVSKFDDAINSGFCIEDADLIPINHQEAGFVMEIKVSFKGESGGNFEHNYTITPINEKYTNDYVKDVSGRGWTKKEWENLSTAMTVNDSTEYTLKTKGEELRGIPNDGILPNIWHCVLDVYKKDVQKLILYNNNGKKRIRWENVKINI